jgi:hypothetical protein
MAILIKFSMTFFRDIKKILKVVRNHKKKKKFKEPGNLQQKEQWCKAKHNPNYKLW